MGKIQQRNYLLQKVFKTGLFCLQKIPKRGKKCLQKIPMGVVFGRGIV
jgi:hypothetical protein